MYTESWSSGLNIKSWSWFRTPEHHTPQDSNIINWSDSHILCSTWYEESELGSIHAIGMDLLEYHWKAATIRNIFLRRLLIICRICFLMSHLCCRFHLLLMILFHHIRFSQVVTRWWHCIFECSLILLRSGLLLRSRTVIVYIGV